MEEKNITFVEHLDELRQHIIKCLIFFGICTAVCYSFINKIIYFLVKPVGRLVFISPSEALIADIKIAGLAGLLVSSPFILYQAWKFISAGLRPEEKKYVRIFCPFSFVLFMAGFFFGYIVIVPISIKFLLGFATDFLAPMITVEKYVSFVFSLSFSFAFIFQLPIVILFLTKVGVLTPPSLIKRRREAVVLIFILAAIITPPDVITQVLMAVPLVLLYEISIILSKTAYKKKVSLKSEGI